MASTPLIIGLTIEQPTGTIRPDIQVKTTNENTTDSKILISGDDGKVIFNLGKREDFPAGWNVGDVVSVSSIYQSFEQKFSFTIPAKGTTLNIKDASNVDVGSLIGGYGLQGTLLLVSTPDAPSLRYFTPQEWLDYFNMKTKDRDAENGIDILQLTRMGEQVEQGIDSSTNSKFDDNNGAYYSSSDIDDGESPEYHDARFFNQSDYFTKFVPIQTLTTFEVNVNAEGATPDWQTLTEAAFEIVVDKKTGRIKIINSSKYPSIGARQARIVYLVGRATTPQDIKQLAIIETGTRMMGATFIRNKIKKISDVDIGDSTSLQHLDMLRTRVIRKYRNHAILPT